MSATKIGFNFRGTSGYVADGADETYAIPFSASDEYPVTREGWTFGHTATFENATDRNSGIDRRLAGIAYQTNNATQAVFRVDLPIAGQYFIRIALGDNSTSEAYQYCQVRDGATPVLTVDDSNGTAMGIWDDAAGTGFDATDWPGSNTPVPVVFAGTILNLAVGTPGAQAEISTFSHLEIEQDLGFDMPVRSRKLATQQRMVA